MPLSTPSGLVSEHEHIYGETFRMRYRMSESPPFADHVTKRNGGSGDENGFEPNIGACLRAYVCVAGVLTSVALIFVLVFKS